jgi:polysaccharide biosynthesis transport protein
MSSKVMAEPLSIDDASVGLRHYLAVLSRRKWIVILVFVLAVAAAGLFTYHQQSKYKAETTIVVGQAGGLVQPQNASAIQPFSATMQELIKSTVVARSVIKALALPLTPEQLLSRVSVSFNPESAALKVGVVDHSPAQAQAIASQLGIVFSGLVKERFGQGAPAIGTTTATPPLTATVWDPAHVIPGKVQPKPVQNLVIAAVLGLSLGLLVAFLRDYFDRTLRTTDEIERAFGMPVIGRIPLVPKKVSDRPNIRWEEGGPYAEAFHSLRASLEYLAVDRPLRRILVTSSVAEEGKTTVCANLAVALAQSGGSVVVLETDLRRPALSSLLGVSSFASGLTNVLVGGAELEETVRRVELPSTGAPNDDDRHLALLPSGPLPPNPSKLLGSAQMRDVVDRLDKVFDSVILDSPPILAVADSVELAKLADGVIVVVRSKQVTRDAAREVRALADRLGIHVVGVVINGVAAHESYGYTAHPPDIRQISVIEPTGEARVPSALRTRTQQTADPAGGRQA